MLWGAQKSWDSYIKGNHSWCIYLRKKNFFFTNEEYLNEFLHHFCLQQIERLITYWLVILSNLCLKRVQIYMVRKVSITLIWLYSWKEVWWTLFYVWLDFFSVLIFTSLKLYMLAGKPYSLIPTSHLLISCEIQIYPQLEETKTTLKLAISEIRSEIFANNGYDKNDTCQSLPK